MPVFKVKTDYTFKGHFIVHAENAVEAVDIVNKQCCLSCGCIESQSGEDVVQDWDFDPRPFVDVTVTELKSRKKKK